MRSVVIVDALRSPMGKYCGTLRNTRPVDLVAQLFDALIKRTSIDIKLIDDFILGQVTPVGDEANLAKQVLNLLAYKHPKDYGWAVRLPAYDVQRNCASGMEAIVRAATSIRAGEGEVYVAGGVEVMSQFSPEEIAWGLTDPVYLKHMAETAEHLANNEYFGPDNFKPNYGSSVEEHYGYAINSHKKALLAIERGRFKKEISPVRAVKPIKAFGSIVWQEHIIFDTDETPISRFVPESYLREPQLNHNWADLFNLLTNENGNKPLPIVAFGEMMRKYMPQGCKKVVATTSCATNDGAALLLIMSDKKAQKLGYKPLAEIIAHASAGVDPRVMGLGPMYATKKVLKRTGWKLDDIDIIELNEPFAAVAIANIKSLGLDPKKVNPNGGAIALGHPVGMTGARITLTLAYELHEQKAEKGLATLCVGGGQGSALLLQRC